MAEVDIPVIIKGYHVFLLDGVINNSDGIFHDKNDDIGMNKQDLRFYITN
jgi:hypothetical protein